MVADLLVVVGTRLAVDERYLQALTGIEGSSRAAGRTGANDNGVIGRLAGHVGRRFCSKCRRSLTSRGAQIILMKPSPTGPIQPGSMSRRSMYSVESPRRS